MARFKLGRERDARETLEELRERWKDAEEEWGRQKWGQDADAKALLAEAEAMIGGAR